MNNFVLLTDAASDLSCEQRKKIGVEVIPMEITVDDKPYMIHPDLSELDYGDFYTNLKKGTSVSTTQINTCQYEDFFEPYLKDGKDIIYVCFPATLSGTYNNSLKACKSLSEKYPERKICSIDSYCASNGFGLLMYLSAMKKNSGATYEEVKSYIEETRNHLWHWFTVDDLNQLKRGGRISATTALVGGMMGIKPILLIESDGSIKSTGKVRGRKASIDALFNNMKKNIVNPDGQTVFIGHGHCYEDAEYLANLIKKEWNITDIQINYIGPIIGAHSGYGTLALFFLGEKR